MSVITDVVVITCPGEDDAIAAVNARMVTEAPDDFPERYHLRKVSDEGRYGGSKVPSTEVWGGCFNYLPFAEFMEALAAAPWKLPSVIVAYIWHEADDDIRTWRPGSGYMNSPPPVPGTDEEPS